MKPVQITCLSLLMAFAVSCKDTPNETGSPQDQQPQTTDKVRADAAHNSQNSLDWAGTYSGVTPCADCPGMKTDMTLNTDNTYSLQEQYLKKEKTPRSFKGSFTWDEAKSVITLDAEGDHHKFKVMENGLRLLDKFGDEKQGGKPEDFVLPKVK